MEIHAHGTGLSALEMMITLSVVSILLLTGIPAFQEFSMRQHMKAAVSSLHYDLLMGRSEAVYLNTKVLGCPGTPAGGCTGDTDWSGGWIVFADRNGDRQRQKNEALIRYGPGWERMKISSSAGRSDIRFFPDGSAPGSNVSISFCGLGGPQSARKLVISILGRIRRDSHTEINPENCPEGA